MSDGYAVTHKTRYAVRGKTISHAKRTVPWGVKVEWHGLPVASVVVRAAGHVETTLRWPRKWLSRRSRFQLAAAEERAIRRCNPHDPKGLFKSAAERAVLGSTPIAGEHAVAAIGAEKARDALLGEPPIAGEAVSGP